MECELFESIDSLALNNSILIFLAAFTVRCRGAQELMDLTQPSSHNSRRSKNNTHAQYTQYTCTIPLTYWWMQPKLLSLLSSSQRLHHRQNTPWISWKIYVLQRKYYLTPNIRTESRPLRTLLGPTLPHLRLQNFLTLYPALSVYRTSVWKIHP